MKIDLKYILSRNNSSLAHFIEYNKIDSYEALLLVCESRNFVPVSRKEFEEVMTIVINEKNEKTKAEKPQSKPTRKSQTKRRSTSSAKRKRTARSGPKDVKDT
tara:strand:+ start:1206 stop:1514 length:309 start_codon:yes stop_codon:yes gene_type:complete